MLDEPEKRVGNLLNIPKNPNASQALLRRPGNVEGLIRAQLLGSGGSASATNSEFEAMMAANQCQNKIIADVLDGPVSQQTQRQLAQIQTLNQNHPVMEEIAENQKISSEDSINNQIKASKNNLRNLSPGSTIVKGAGTGSIFNPAQMTAYKQKYGIGFNLSSKNLNLTRNRSDNTTGTDPSKDPISPPEGIRKTNKNKTLKNGKDITNSSDASFLKDENSNSSGEKLTHEEIESMINKAATALGIDPALVKAVVKAESNFNHTAVSKAGAQGLMQLMPRTAKEMGVEDPFDPLQNIWGGARYLKRMLDRHGGNINKALAAYNWGPGNLERHGYGGNLPGETRRYIEVVNKNYSNFKKDTMEA
jgi:hypothetical protein